MFVYIVESGKPFIFLENMIHYTPRRVIIKDTDSLMNKDFAVNNLLEAVLSNGTAGHTNKCEACTDTTNLGVIPCSGCQTKTCMFCVKTDTNPEILGLCPKCYNKRKS